MGSMNTQPSRPDWTGNPGMSFFSKSCPEPSPSSPPSMSAEDLVAQGTALERQGDVAGAIRYLECDQHPAGGCRYMAPEGERLQGPRGEHGGDPVLRRSHPAPARDLRALDAEGKRPRGPGPVPGSGGVLRRGPQAPAGQPRGRQESRGRGPGACAGRRRPGNGSAGGSPTSRGNTPGQTSATESHLESSTRRTRAALRGRADVIGRQGKAVETIEGAARAGNADPGRD